MASVREITTLSHDEIVALNAEREKRHEAWNRLPLEQREALLLVTEHGETYADVAARCGVAEGTIKSRVNRARTRLAAMLQMENRHDLGPDRLMQAALQHSKAAASM